MAFNPLSPEWPKQTADQVERVVQKVRQTFTRRAVTATNAVVFGLLIAVATLVAALVGLIVFVRSIQAYLTWEMDTPAAWVVGVAALLGIVVLLAGLVKSATAVTAVGASAVVVAGSRWALTAGDATIEHETAVWISYLLIGGVFLLVGAFLMARRHTPES